MTRPHLLHQPARPRARGPSSLKQRPSWRERGSASIQMVLIMPALFSVMFLGMQAALHYHARTIAIAALPTAAIARDEKMNGIMPPTNSPASTSAL